MYSVEHNIFITLVATRFSCYDHHQASAIQNLKKAGYMFTLTHSQAL